MKESINRILLFLLLTTPVVGLQSCKKDSNSNDKPSINLFTIQDDKDFGAQVSAEIEADPATYPILDSATYPEAYGHIHRITDNVLGCGKLKHRDDFVWNVKIIHDDSTLNAFCTPGGYIYVYTGLIKFLEAEDELAGVMGHEIAHADERHSTEALTKQYGIEVLFAVLFGEDQGTLAQIAKGMIELKYSRNNEAEADQRSVEYLYATDYDARGAARFFEKILALGGGNNVPEFLSTHPSEENRVQDITSHWEDLGGKVGERFVDRYTEFKKTLP